VTFFVVLFSVLVQGTTLPLAARWLRVRAEDEVVASPLSEAAGGR
jgi:cell volume regulation protein A